MTTQELHIELDLLLQKVNSHWNQNLLPQEKDLFLNREVTRFIKQRLSRLSNLKGVALFDTIKRTIDLVPLLKTVSLPVIFDNNKEARIMLPFDYLYYVSAGLTTCCVCANKELITGTYYELEFSPIKERTSLPLVFRNGLYSFTIEQSDIPDDYLIEHQIPIYKNNIMLINALMILLNKKNNTLIEFSYNNRTNKIIARCSTSFSLNGEQAKLYSYKRYEKFTTDLTSTVRIENEEFKTNASNSYLSGSKDESCLAYLRNDSVNFIVPNGVIYGVCHLTYICKPSKINLSLQSDCNLSDETMEEIVANTAQRLHGVIGTDNYEKYVKENVLIE